jgi:predicted  nucleic acid-binding Zn-ribbon protein
LKEQLQLLAKLQEIDQVIDQHEHELARLPLEIQDIARGLVSLRREIAENKEKLTAIEKDLRKSEQDLAVEQEKIKRSERRLLGIKNQKEYNALSREVKLGKKVVGEIEDAILGFMTETEGLKRGLEKKESDYQGLESDLLAKKAEAETISNQAKEALVDLNSQKEKIAESIEREFLKKYQMVKKVRGTGIAELDNGTCTGCHMAIPPQLNIRVLKQEEFIICPNCNRILYVRPENIPIYNKLES